MKNLITAVVVAAASVCFEASALDIVGDSSFLGNVVQGTSDNTTTVSGWVNHIVDMQVGSSDSFSGLTFDRSANTVPSGLPDAVFAASLTPNGPYFDLGAQSYLYLSADYGAGGTFFWYIPGLTGTQQISLFQNSSGLARVWVYNRGVAQVPDSGTTVMMLGLVLSGLAVVRRNLS